MITAKPVSTTIKGAIEIANKKTNATNKITPIPFKMSMFLTPMLLSRNEQLAPNLTIILCQILSTKNRWGRVVVWLLFEIDV